MSKNVKESKLSPVEVAAIDPASDELVEVQALRQVNTTLYGNISAGKRGKVCPAPGAAVIWRLNVTYYTGVAR